MLRLVPANAPLASDVPNRRLVDGKHERIKLKPPQLIQVSVSSSEQRMGWGGARPGAGQRKDAKFTREMRAEAAKKAHAVLSGETSPLDVMVARMRDPQAVSYEQFQAAEACAPYIHPRLAAVAVQQRGETTLADLIALATRKQATVPAIIEGPADTCAETRSNPPVLDAEPKPTHNSTHNPERQRLLLIRQQAVAIGAQKIVDEVDAMLKELGDG